MKLQCMCICTECPHELLDPGGTSQAGRCQNRLTDIVADGYNLVSRRTGQPYPVCKECFDMNTKGTKFDTIEEAYTALKAGA